MKRRVVVTTGTRADYGFLRPIIRKILDNKKFELFLVVTGTHLSKKHGMTINEIKKQIKMIPNNDSLYSMSIALGKGIIEFSSFFKKIKPDINIILGDRDEMLASAIAAYHMGIPNAHIQGGDTSGGLDEYNRHAITKISNIHFAGSKKSMIRIIKMGENSKNVFLTGSTSIDEIVSGEISEKKTLENKYGFKFSEKMILLVQHPDTIHIEKSEKQIQNILNAIVNLRQNTIAIAPNSDAGGKKIFQILLNYSKKYDFINVFPNLPRSDYLGFLKNCSLLIGNSSSGMIESTYFQTPVINIGKRQQNREHGNHVKSIDGNTIKSIQNNILKNLKSKKKSKITKIYGDGNSSLKIVKILEKIKLNKDLVSKSISY